MYHRKRSLAAAVLAGCAGLASLDPIAVAAAQDALPRATIDWQTAEGCPDRDALQREVEARLGRPLTQSGRRSIAVTGRIVRSDRGAELTLATTIDGQQGTRTLQGQECVALTQAAALIVALSVDPDLPANPAAPAPKPITAARPPREPKPSVRSDVARDDQQLRVSGRASVLLDLGSLPTAAIGPALALGAHRQRVWLELGAAYLPPASAALSQKPSAHLQLALAQASLTGCYALARGALAVWPCAQLDVGQSWGRVTGIAAPQLGRTLWLAAGAQARAVWHLTRGFGLALELGASFPLARSRFRIGGVGNVQETPNLVGRASLGVLVEL